MGREIFDFKENMFAFSIDTPGKGEYVDSDLLFKGDSDLLSRGLLQRMRERPEIAAIILCTANRFLLGQLTSVEAPIDLSVTGKTRVG